MTVGEVAESSGLGESLIESLENGRAKPDMSILRVLANTYVRSTAALLLPRPPEEPSGPEDFRTLPREDSLPLSKKTRLAMRRARRLQTITTELRSDTTPIFHDIIDRIDLLDDPELIAMYVRNVLDIPYDVQKRWGDEAEAFEKWRVALSELGVLVLKMSMDMSEARAFSLRGDHVPIIVVNSKDSMNGMIFSLMHELGHLLLHNEGVCIPSHAVAWEFDRLNERGTTRKVEIFCNHLAGAILVPKEYLVRQSLVKHTERPRDWSNRELDELVKVFHVSREVILRRLILLKKTSRAFYKAKHEEWSEKGESRGRKGGGKGRNMPRECVSQNGAQFVSLVLDSYKNDRITYSEVADILDVKVKYIPEIERLVEAH